MDKPRPGAGPPATPEDGQRRVLRLETKLSTVEEFVKTFSRLIDDSSLFIVTKSTLPVGARRRFIITLKGGKVVFAGDGEVTGSAVHLAGPTSPVGIRFDLKKLTPPSIQMHARLLEVRRERANTVVEPLPKPTLPMVGDNVDDEVTNVEPPAERFGASSPKVPPLKARPGTPLPGLSGDSTVPGPPGGKGKDGPRRTPPLGAPRVVPRALPAQGKGGVGGSASDEDEEKTVSAKGLKPSEPAEKAEGSSLILPANPLSDLPDVGLHALIEIQIYEDAGFPREEFDVELQTPRPELVSRTATSVDAVAGDDDDDDDDIDEDGDEARNAGKAAVVATKSAEGAVAPAGDGTRLGVPAAPDDPGDAGAADSTNQRDPASPVAVRGGDDTRPGFAPPEAVAAGAPRLSTPFPVQAPPPVKVSAGFGSQLLVAILAAGLGFLAGYIVFGTDLLGMRPASSTASAVAEDSGTTTTQVGNTLDTTGAGPVSDAGYAAIAFDAASADDAGHDTDAMTDPGDDGGAVEALGDAGADITGSEADECLAHVTSNPTGARVKIGARELGTTPLDNAAVPCGEELVFTLERSGFRNFQQKLTAELGTPLEIAAELDRAQSRLRILSTPPGAIVTVDGKVRGRTPVNAWVPLSSRILITATLPGHKVWTRQVRAGKRRMTFRAKLDKIGR